LEQPLYALTPGVWRVPMILLATCATVIASQALISGVFTLVQQAIALGLAPRLIVQHTSESLRGQVFLPMVNFMLAVGCIALVLMFQSSSRLASAFGLAVSCTMLATAFAWYHVAIHVLHWKRLTATLTLTLFVLIDGSFIIACLPKFMDGGWVPFSISAVLTIALMTWRDGRARIVTAITSEQVPLESIRAELVAPLVDTSATMVLLTHDPSLVPFFHSHEWVRNRMREERIVLLSFFPARIPRITDAD
jgi:KUP system potassium uptake protein